MRMKDLLKIVPTMMSVELVEENYKKKDNLVKKGVKNILGITLINQTSNLI